jgi:8-oxo-dGTP pyrophosphatase MutT (NUDIX family)
VTGPCDDAAMDDEDATNAELATNAEPATRAEQAASAQQATSARPATASGPWMRHSRRVGYENAWITIWHDEVTRPDGAPGVYGVVHFANLAAGVLVLDDADRVLLVGQHRYPLDAYSWEIPEGGVPAGESALDGARRELLEETGVEATEWRELARVHLSNSVSDELAVLFVATGLSHGDATPDGTEQLAIRWLPFAEVLAMTLDGRITDAMTVVAVERMALLRAVEANGG